MSTNCAKDLTESWIEAQADPSNNSTLMPVEADSIRKVVRMSKSEINLKLDEIMTMKTLQDFLEVETQIKSLERFWSCIVQKKKIRDMGHSNPHKFGIDQQQCLIGLQVIPRRFSIGLSNIAPLVKVSKEIKEILNQIRAERGHEKSARETNLCGDHGSETTEDEPERGRTTKRSTRPGRALRDASEESAARRRKHAAQDCVAKDSTSEESSMAKKRKRRERQTQRTRRKGKSAEDSTSADSGTSDDDITAGKEAKSAVAEDSGPDSYKTGQSRLDSSASEESTVSGKTTHRGRRISRRQQWQTEIPREKRTTPAASPTSRPRKKSKGLTQRKTDEDYGWTAEKQAESPVLYNSFVNARKLIEARGLDFEERMEVTKKRLEQEKKQKQAEKKQKQAEKKQKQAEKKQKQAEKKQKQAEKKQKQAEKKQKQAEKSRLPKVDPFSKKSTEATGWDSDGEWNAEKDLEKVKEILIARGVDFDEEMKKERAKKKPRMPSNPFSKKSTEAIRSDSDRGGSQT